MFQPFLKRHRTWWELAGFALMGLVIFGVPLDQGNTPPNAIVFGTGMVAQRDMMRAGLVLNLVFVVLLTALTMVLF